MPRIPFRYMLEWQLEEETAKWQGRKQLTHPSTYEPPAPIAIPEVTETRQPTRMTPVQQQAQMAQRYRQPSIQAPVTPTPAIQPPPEVPEVEEPEQPKSFWARALDVFTAPFRWVDEYIIQPSLSLVGTAVGIVPEVDRGEGEDFWDWKRRSWDAWEAPGFTLGMPWGDWRIDVKGVAELAPWLLIPGIGQAGTITAGVGKLGWAASKAPWLVRAGGPSGIAGALARLSPKAATALQLSPWGLTEATVGAVLGKVLQGTGKVSTAVGKKFFGEIVEPAELPAVLKLSDWVNSTIKPLYGKFRRGVKQELRPQQAGGVSAILEKVGPDASADDIIKAVRQAGAARAGAIKPQYAATAENIARLQADDIAKIQARIAKGEITETIGKGLITKVKNQYAKMQPVDVVPEGYLVRGDKEVGEGATRMGGTWATDDIAFATKTYGERLSLVEKPSSVLRVNSPSLYPEMNAGAIFGQRFPYKGVGTSANWARLRQTLKKEGYDAVEFLLPNGQRETWFLGRPKLEPFPRGGMQWTDDEMRELLQPVLSSMEKRLTQEDLLEGMIDLLVNGVPLQRAQWNRLTNIYGKTFAGALKGMEGLSPNALARALDVANIPRALLSSGDLSITMRQTAILTLMHPIKAARWMQWQVKSFLSEKWADDITAQMEKDADFIEMARLWGEPMPSYKAGVLAVERAEAFPSKVAEVLPFVKRSERAFVNYGNAARLGSYKASKAYWVAHGAGEKELELLVDFIMNASGRGKLPLNLTKYNPIFNTFFFSPRLQFSRWGTLKTLTRMLIQGARDPTKRYMSREAAKAITVFFGGGAAMLGLLNAFDIAKVDIDPRSSDFAKIRLNTGKKDSAGNPIYSDTRLDIWTGYVQYTRFLAQLTTGESKSAFGNLSERERMETVLRFGQSKFSPAAGLLADLLKGETYMGEEMFTDTSGFLDYAKEKIVPLAMQDIIDAVEQSGWNSVGTFSASTAFLGVGVLTYVNDLVRIRNKIARQEGYEHWEEIDPATQKRLENKNAELQVAMLEYDRAALGSTWGDWNIAGRAIEQVFEDGVEQATLKFRETGDGYEFREKVNSLFEGRRFAYGAREEDERFLEVVNRLKIEDPLEQMVKLGPEQMAIKIYNDALYGDDMYDKYGEYNFDLVSEKLAQIRGSMSPEMFQYVEDYKGIKYETLPQEYQLLAESRRVLRPYWQVEDEVIRQKGAPRNAYQQTIIDRLVGRIRKRMLRMNPEMAKYYDLFWRRPD